MKCETDKTQARVSHLSEQCHGLWLRCANAEMAVERTGIYPGSKVATQLGLNLAEVGKAALNLPQRYRFDSLSKSCRKRRVEARPRN